MFCLPHILPHTLHRVCHIYNYSFAIHSANVCGLSICLRCEMLKSSQKRFLFKYSSFFHRLNIYKGLIYCTHSFGDSFSVNYYKNFYFQNIVLYGIIIPPLVTHTALTYIATCSASQSYYAFNPLHHSR